ncbi:MAG: hypothetical protein KKG75_00930 [Nanoarchaeota archaeon]|nr:hypothetical protein [Nanoarchaeota archaeon]
MLTLRVISGVLDILALFFTVVLLAFGFSKGYHLVELTTYDIYFLVIIINQLINLIGKLK